MRTEQFQAGQVVRLTEPAVVHYATGAQRWEPAGTQFRLRSLPSRSHDLVKVQDADGRKALVFAVHLEPVPADDRPPADDPDDPEPDPAERRWDLGEPVARKRKHRRPDLPVEPTLKELVAAGLLGPASALAR